MGSGRIDIKKYRPDIDGLRALAIIPVVLFHLNTPYINGGFVGVDIFFVISGYLIIGLIADDARRENYSLKNFYIRRARRIFPVFFAVILFLIVTMAFLLFPSEFSALNHSILYAIFFISNFHFYTLDGYFNEKLLTNPLLHTWSLSVEEQFYILFPLIMFVMRKKFVRYIKQIVGAIFFASFAYCLWVSAHASNAAFYLLPSRAWELMLGGLLAVNIFPAIRYKIVAEISAALGLALITYAALYTQHTHFPGIQALWPCLGAALLIHAGRNPGFSPPLVSQGLSLYPVRFVGLISYSLYMWHWPFIVIARYTYWPNGYYKAVLLAVIIVVSILSWRYIEQPFRKNHAFSKSKITFTLSASTMIFLVVATFIVSSMNAKAWNLDAKTIKTLAYLNYDPDPYFRTNECFIQPGSSATDMLENKCLAANAHKKSILIIGDSHAADLWYGLSHVLTDFDIQQGTATGCQPFLNAKGEPECIHIMNFLFKEYLKNHYPDIILLSARWGKDGLPDLMETIRYLDGKSGRLYVIGPMVEYNMALPRLLALEDVGLSSLFKSQLHNSKFDMDVEMKDVITHNTKAQYVSIIDILCDHNRTCRKRTDDDTPMEFDEDHLTIEGSIYVAQAMKRMGLFDIAPVH